MTVITSLQNPKIKAIVALRDRRKRDQAGLMLVEGYEELSLALASGARPVEVYYCPQFAHQIGPKIANALIEQAQHSGGQIIEVSDRVFEKMAYRDNPDGWLATFPTLHRRLSDLSLSANPFIVVAEGVEKPGNLGAILRTADAAGIDALISCDPHTDWGNPNVIRASKGALFSVPVAEASTGDTIQWLRQHNIKIVAASPQATAVYTQVNMRGPVAITVGTEKQGLSAAWLDQADIAVSIPMFGKVNSLNVATATALLIYEVVRQRGYNSADR